MKTIKHFYTLELMRFVAALAVVIYHYPRVFLSTFSGIKINKAMPYTWSHLVPFYDHLWRFYVQGLKAVPFFWALSGFVLGYAYLNKTNYQISAKKYFTNRFARLYPLHLLTLLIVLTLQLIIKKQTEFYQLYPMGGASRFFAHLFFISSWHNHAPDFNAPIWSVSIETLIYFLFFLLIKPLYHKRFVISVPLTAMLILLYKSHSGAPGFVNPNIMPCARFFFTGVLAYLAFDRFQKNYFFFCISAIALIISARGALQLNILFPAILIVAAYLDIIMTNKFKTIFSSLGNLTYSMYLLHVPLQLLMVLVVFKLKLSFSIFSNKMFFILYILSLCFLSFLCFKYFEKPLMIYIRNFSFSDIKIKYLNKKKSEVNS